MNIGLRIFNRGKIELEDIFESGNFKGHSLKQVILDHPEYVDKVIGSNPRFELDDAAEKFFRPRIQRWIEERAEQRPAYRGRSRSSGALEDGGPVE